MPATFTTLMNNIFHKYLDDFVIIYIDNILVFLKMAEDHVEYLEKMFYNSDQTIRTQIETSAIGANGKSSC